MPREEEDEEQHQAGSSKRRHHDDDEGTETSVSSLITWQLVFVRSCSVLKSICLLLCACAADGEGGEEEGGKGEKNQRVHGLPAVNRGQHSQRLQRARWHGVRGEHLNSNDFGDSCHADGPVVMGSKGFARKGASFNYFSWIVKKTLEQRD